MIDGVHRIDEIMLHIEPDSTISQENEKINEIRFVKNIITPQDNS